MVSYTDDVTRQERRGARGLVSSPAPSDAESIAVNAELLQLDSDLGVKEAIRALEDEPGVSFAEPDYHIEPAATPDDPATQRQMADILGLGFDDLETPEPTGAQDLRRLRDALGLNRAKSRPASGHRGIHTAARRGGPGVATEPPEDSPGVRGDPCGPGSGGPAGGTKGRPSKSPPTRRDMSDRTWTSTAHEGKSGFAM